MAQPDFERLAAMKLEAKQLEVQIKQLQEKILKTDAQDKVETEVGTLTLTERPNIKCTDNTTLYNEIGHRRFVRIASISFGALKKAVGEDFAQDMIDDGVYERGQSSFFYTFRVKK